MVSVGRWYLSQHLLGVTQCHRLVEEPPVSRKEGIDHLHCHSNAFNTLLDSRDHRQFSIFQPAI